MTSSDLTDRRSVTAELARREAMLETIGYAATRIVGGGDWQAGIQDLLARLGKAAEVDRVTLFETHKGPDNEMVQSCRYDWCVSPLKPISSDPRYQNMPIKDPETPDDDEFDDWARRRQRGEVIQTVRSATSGYTREVFEEHGTLSFLSVPLTAGGRWWGFLGFDDCRTERAWTEIEIDVLRTAAALIAGAIERQQTEAEIARQREALHQSEKLTALGSLLAGVAHELNNPLSVVVGQALLLEEATRDSALTGRAQKIRYAAERCSKIVRTFLALARRREPEARPVQLNAIVGMAVDLLGYQLRTSGVELTLDLAPDLPAFMADADQLHQVTTNLIVNAEQALAERPAPRRLKISTRFDKARQALRLVVADNGPGIEPEIRSRIFDPFFTTKPAGQGTGIGLSLCMTIVGTHRGSITPSETPGGGATFTVELPLAGLPAPKPAPALEPASRDNEPGRRILVVDDEVEIAETLAEILTDLGHRVEMVSQGAAALNQLKAGPFDLILSDLKMPVLDGPGLYAALQRDYPAMTGKIAFLTGDTLSQRQGEFLAETGAACLEKPFTPDDVRRFVGHLLQQAH
ncbi:hybrid sensor histidine kinase/response regulator [Hypericibacter sp.]|uniref:hybrid sensor histidine kinase/response regulator n=1 Tax=Hypericibacter sp. TaxID=2705401 RepID=UPI003D6D6B3C